MFICVPGRIHMCTMTHAFVYHNQTDMYTHLYVHTSICIHIYIHRKSSLYLPLSSVNLVLKLMGTPDGIFNPFGLKSCFTVVVPGFPWNLYTKLTETPRQIKTTFPMNMYSHRSDVYTYVYRHLYVLYMYTHLYVHTSL